MLIIDPAKRITVHVVVAMEAAEQHGARCAAWSPSGDHDLDDERGAEVEAYVGADEANCRLGSSVGFVVEFAVTSLPRDLETMDLLAENEFFPYDGKFFVWLPPDKPRTP